MHSEFSKGDWSSVQQEDVHGGEVLNLPWLVTEEPSDSLSLSWLMDCWHLLDAAGVLITSLIYILIFHFSQSWLPYGLFLNWTRAMSLQPENTQAPHGLWGKFTDLLLMVVMVVSRQGTLEAKTKEKTELMESCWRLWEQDLMPTLLTWHGRSAAVSALLRSALLCITESLP